MTTEDERRPRPDDDRPSRGRLRAVTSAGLRVLADLLILSLWVLALTLAFLAFGWPRWAFYGALLLGVGVYVSITSEWWGSTVADGGA
ncbi:hypothetical protein SAMN05444422_101807 [Halobiforma haloterrestris]|uniref:DUF8119 domain-containing protein n=1 Tax=Natronobacterium haloterrestre TaxID=148448 RepID=A0A1I1DTL6_NATHA|nr:hypothetical protein [Halobiforma haloterrestris]SFB76060.1 hypothetical protein SAMN05444422_101807 [Halobiforma haloterrestris]